MSRFNNSLKRLQALDRESSLAPLFYAFSLLGLLAYVLPWVHNPGQALTLGAYDLAEWLSLHPGVRFQSPPLLASALIRLHLVLLSGLIVLWMPRRLWVWTLGFVVLLVLAQLPPAEFVSQREDMNYQQQLGLAVLTLILCGGLAVWSRRTLATLMLGVVGIGVCVWGVIQAREFMQVFHLPAWMGLGAPLLMLVYLAMIGVIWGREPSGE